MLKNVYPSEDEKSKAIFSCIMWGYAKSTKTQGTVTTKSFPEEGKFNKIYLFPIVGLELASRLLSIKLKLLTQQLYNQGLLSSK